MLKAPYLNNALKKVNTKLAKSTIYIISINLILNTNNITIFPFYYYNYLLIVILKINRNLTIVP